MPTDPNILEYIERARASGMADAQIEQDLANAGWKPEDYAGMFMPSAPREAESVMPEPQGPAPLEPVPVLRGYSPESEAPKNTRAIVAGVILLMVLCGTYLGVAKYALNAWPFVRSPEPVQSAAPSTTPTTSLFPSRSYAPWTKNQNPILMLSLEFPQDWTAQSKEAQPGVLNYSLMGAEGIVEIIAYNTEKTASPEIGKIEQRTIGALDCQAIIKAGDRARTVCAFSVMRYKISFEPADNAIVQKIVGTIAPFEPQAKDRDTRRIDDIRKLWPLLKRYYDAHKKFPLELSELTPEFIAVIPADPITQFAYHYAVSSTRQQFHIGATLENAAHPNLAQDSDFDSTAAQGWSGGFSGYDAHKCDPEDIGAECFDLKF